MLDIKEAPKLMLVCPFCDSEKVKITHINKGNYYQGLCNKCHSRGPKTHSVIDALQKWNERSKHIVSNTVEKELESKINEKQLKRFLDGEIVLQCTSLVQYIAVVSACRGNVGNVKRIENWIGDWFNHKENTVLDSRSSAVDEEKPWLGYSDTSFFKEHKLEIEEVKLDYVKDIK